MKNCECVEMKRLISFVKETKMYRFRSDMKGQS